MAKEWFKCQPVETDFGIERTDHVFIREIGGLEDIPVAFFEATIDYFKSQRLMPDEMRQLDQLLQEGKRPDGTFRQELILAFAEGLLGKDFRPLDECECLGTFAEVFFKWMRESFLQDQIVYCHPEFATGSSTTQGVDYFEIVGDKGDIDSLYFIVWEIKGTDAEVSSRTDEIFQQHKMRTNRLLRGLQRKLPDRYEREGEPVLYKFASYLMDYWMNNDPQKRLGGCVVYSAENQPGTVFSTFAEHFPDLACDSCRQVRLVSIPCFREVRAKVLELLWNRIALTPKP